MGTSDFDLIVVMESLPGAGLEAEVGGRVLSEAGLVLDLQVTTRRGAAFSHVISPEWRVAWLTGWKLGDWSWLDTSLPLAWQGADDYLGMTRMLWGVADSWGGLPDARAGDYIAVMRRVMVLRAAVVGIAEEAQRVCWRSVAEALGIPEAAVRKLRAGGAAGLGEASVQRTRERVQAALDVVKQLVAAYPRNAGDEYLGTLLAAAREKQGDE